MAQDPISCSPIIWVWLEFDIENQIRAELKLWENGWSDLGAVLSDPPAFRVDYSHKYFRDFTDFIHHVMFVFWKWPARAATTLAWTMTCYTTMDFVQCNESYEIIWQRSILRGKDKQQLCGRYGRVHKYRQVKHIVDLYLDLCLVL